MNSMAKFSKDAVEMADDVTNARESEGKEFPPWCGLYEERYPFKMESDIPTHLIGGTYG